LDLRRVGQQSALATLAPRPTTVRSIIAAFGGYVPGCRR